MPAIYRRSGGEVAASKAGHRWRMSPALPAARTRIGVLNRRLYTAGLARRRTTPAAGSAGVQPAPQQESPDIAAWWHHDFTSVRRANEGSCPCLFNPFNPRSTEAGVEQWGVQLCSIEQLLNT